MRAWTAARTSRCWSIRLLPVELRRAHGRPQVVAAAGLVDRPRPRRRAAPSAIIRLISARSAIAVSRTPAAPLRPPRASPRCARTSPAGGPAARRAPLGAVDRLPALVGDVVRGALGEQLLDRGRIGVAAPEAIRPASTSSSRLSTVSWASFLLVPITPDGPRLIQPTAYWPGTCSPLSGSVTRPPSLGITPRRSSNGTPVQPDALVADRARRRGRTRSSRARRCRARGSRRTRPGRARCGRRRSARPCRRPGSRRASAGSAARSACGLPSGSRCENSVKISTFLRVVMSASSDSR